jgi:hypothetical protein
MKDAREWANLRGIEWEVMKYTVAKIDLKTFVSALNNQEWAADQEVAAVVQPRKGKRIA